MEANKKVPMSLAQWKSVQHAMKGEEGAYFVEIVAELQKTFDTMPRVYEQGGKGDEAVAYLHYFIGGSDWWITERDITPGQYQAFGFVCLNGDKENAELGYINLHEVTLVGAELDFHFKPRRLAEIKKEVGL